jgi:hypothetical protein
VIGLLYSNLIFLNMLAIFLYRVAQISVKILVKRIKVSQKFLYDLLFTGNFRN